MSTATTGVTFSRLIVDALEQYRDREAFIQDGATFTYSQTADIVGRMRRVLTALGVTVGVGVGVLSQNRAESWMTQAATWLAGGRYTPLHPLGSEDDHVFVCDDAELIALVVDPVFADRAAAIAQRSLTIKHVLTLGPASIGDDLLALVQDIGANRLDPGPAGEEDTCFLQYTGGTTGVPKGVMVPQRAMAQATQSWLASCDVPRTPRYLATSPITHAALIPVLPTLSRGGTIVLHQGFDAERWVQTVERERINCAFAVPTMIYGLLDHGHPEAHDLSSLQAIAYAGAPMSPARLSEALERMGQVFVQAYGQAESMMPATCLTRADHDPVHEPELLASCGHAGVGYDVRILGEENQELPAGEVGEICIRSRGVMTGYWKRPDLTATALAGGWLHTADVGRRDERGYVYIVDRTKDMVISGGFNIYPKEIEDVLTAHPDVSMAAVIGVPDERWGEAVKALVVPRPGASIDPSELVGLVREKKGPTHAPKSLEVVDDLPVTSVGKVDKKVLRAAHWTDGGRQVN